MDTLVLCHVVRVEKVRHDDDGIAQAGGITPTALFLEVTVTSLHPLRLSLEVTVTSLHPLRLCRMIIASRYFH